MPRAAAVLTASDGVTHGTRKDDSGDLVERLLQEAGFAVTERVAVPDDIEAIVGELERLSEQVRLIVTTGGTGFGPRDVTPEATTMVIERPAPGLVHLMIREGLDHTPMAALSRATAGSVGSTLIVNLPGSPRGAGENLAAVLPVIGHALDLLEGDTEHS